MRRYRGWHIRRRSAAAIGALTAIDGLDGTSLTFVPVAAVPTGVNKLRACHRRRQRRNRSCLNETIAAEGQDGAFGPRSVPDLCCP
jgi:hypothetical protein